MTTFVDWLFDISPFPPRRECGDWGEGLVELFRGHQLGIGLAYLAIPAALIGMTVARQRRRGDVTKAHASLVALACLFIGSCAVSHLLDRAMFTWPAYRALAAWLVFTDAVSWAFFFTLLALGRRLIELPTPADHQRALDAAERLADRAEAQGDLFEHRPSNWHDGQQLQALLEELERAHHRIDSIYREAKNAARPPAN